MSKRGIIGFTLLTIGVIAFFGLMIYLSGAPALLNPKGPIAAQQKDLLLFSTALMLVVVIPVFALAGFVAIRYRAGNTKAKYEPNWDSNKKLEALWWGIPLVLVVILSVVAWRTSHSLDPYLALNSDKEAVNIEVVALQWKWLFLYPDYNVATVNYAPVPVDTPLAFTIAADAPMNSFWIPELGGQIYAMNGMSTKLHLQADQAGDFNGVSANISGEGFADMKFIIQARDGDTFSETMKDLQGSSIKLDKRTYEQLAEPSVMETESYVLSDPDLYDKIIEKYMPHGHGGEQ